MGTIAEVCTSFVINKKGMEKQAFVRPPNKPAKWTSKFGSITFDQIGVAAPIGGMNEKGSVITQMTLLESKFSESDNKDVVGELDEVQYQLDNSAALSDIIENINKVKSKYGVSYVPLTL